MEYKSLLHTLGWFGGCRQVFFNIQEKMSHLWRLQMSTCPVKAVSEAVTIQDRFMVLWNTRKSLFKIWQCFSCLFSKRNAKTCMKLNFFWWPFELLKFSFSEKATKNCAIFLMVLTFTYFFLGLPTKIQCGISIFLNFLAIIKDGKI